MAENKKYYWLKLPKDFFERKEVKLLRKLENGAVCVLIYQKILLNALETDGEIYFDHLTDTPEEELALSINEEVEDVRNVLKFLLDKQLVTVLGDVYYIEKLSEMVGKEGRTASIMRKARAKEKQNVSNETSIIKDVTENCHNVTDCVTLLHREEKEKSREDKEIDIEKEKEINKEINKDIDKDKKQDIKDRVDIEDRVDKTLDEILSENEQLYYKYIQDKTLTEQQKEYMFQQVKRYRKIINENHLRGFYNHAKQFITEQKGE